MGFCSVVGHLHHAMLQSQSGVCRWATVDSADGRKGWSWVLQASNIMQQADLPHAYQLAQRLFHRSQTNMTESEERSVVDELGGMIDFTPGVPTGTGSGGSGATNKQHALLHSERLVSASWGDAVNTYNSTIKLQEIWGQKQVWSN